MDEPKMLNLLHNYGIKSPNKLDKILRANERMDWYKEIVRHFMMTLQATCYNAKRHDLWDKAWGRLGL